MYIFAPGMAIAGRTGITAVLNLGTAVLNTALNLALIPLLGIVGAAIATFISAGCLFGGYMILSQRLYFVPHQWVPLGVATTVCGISILAAHVFLPADPVGFVSRLVVLALVSSSLAGLRLIRLDEVVAFWQRLRRPGPA
jgi:O-antigen/teichoic acid export membrane protein